MVLVQLVDIGSHGLWALRRSLLTLRNLYTHLFIYRARLLTTYVCVLPSLRVGSLWSSVAYCSGLMPNTNLKPIAFAVAFAFYFAFLFGLICPYTKCLEIAYMLLST